MLNDKRRHLATSLVFLLCTGTSTAQVGTFQTYGQWIPETICQPIATLNCSIPECPKKPGAVWDIRNNGRTVIWGTPFPVGTSTLSSAAQFYPETLNSVPPFGEEFRVGRLEIRNVETLEGTNITFAGMALGTNLVNVSIPFLTLDIRSTPNTTGDPFKDADRFGVAAWPAQQSFCFSSASFFQALTIPEGYVYSYVDIMGYLNITVDDEELGLSGASAGDSQLVLTRLANPSPGVVVSPGVHAPLDVNLGCTNEIVKELPGPFTPGISPLFVLHGAPNLDARQIDMQSIVLTFPQDGLSLEAKALDFADYGSPLPSPDVDCLFGPPDGIEDVAIFVSDWILPYVLLGHEYGEEISISFSAYLLDGTIVFGAGTGKLVEPEPK